jgi:hypothetical protein
MTKDVRIHSLKNWVFLRVEQQLIVLCTMLSVCSELYD